ncbi:MAG: 3'-5' exoribonuclease [Pyrinomonadaceae bacterium]|nr:3'-5' exoribonuclease [Pyrinomonadaceae bacterium]
MSVYPNLISESILITETIELLQSFGGRASAVKVVDNVMQIRKPEPNLAKKLVLDLVNSDPRLTLNEDVVEFVPLNHESRNLAETDYVVFDLETTGAKCPPCRVTEIGAFRVQNGKIVDKFHTLVNPEMPIPIFITQLTGISDAMVRTAPKFAEIADSFLEFIGDSVLVAHNAPFDIRFLNHEVSKVYGNYRVANPHLCTVQLSRKLVPHIENHKLNTVAQYFSVNLENHHRASHDAHATARIFINLLEDLQSRGISDLATARKIKL